MTHLTIKNPFKNQGLAIFVALRASFGKRFGKKNLFKINEMSQMAQIVGLKWRVKMAGRGFKQASKKRKKQVKENVNEM